ncbi:MAG TPA: periplasmic heavy metal sensor [Azospirillum sp.]|nr:periplasmic heavy metal sensor [Azospirillum sp.]
MIALTRPRVSFRLLALASLGLNLFLGAMLVSAYHHQQPAPSLPMPDRLVERVAPDLPEADAERVRRAFTAKRAQFAALDEEYRQATQRVRAAAAREPLDREELRALIDSARAARRRIGDLVEETMLSLLPELSLSARERLVAGRR